MWHLLSLNDKLIYDLGGCENFDKIFNNPRKDKAEIYLLDISRFGADKDNIIMDGA